METFKNTAAQGDVYFRRINEMPTGYVEVPPENGQLIVTHSETGHHHVMDPSAARMYRNPKNDLDAVLVVDRPTSINHLRSFDTHKPILFDAGIYNVRRQREYTLDGFRKVQD